MSVGGTRAPYRANCGFTNTDGRKHYLGSKWKHARTDARHVEKLQNTTKVPNYLDPSCDGYVAGDIAPYSKLNGVFYECQGGTGGECDILCGPWAEPVPVNTYAPYDPKQYENLSACRKLGWKYAIARKAWHGRLPWTNPDNCCYPSDGCCSAPANNTPANTKYLTLTYALTATKTFQASPITDIATNTWTINGTVSVDRYSGKKTLSGCTYSREDKITTALGVVTSDTTYTPSDATAAALGSVIIPVCPYEIDGVHQDDPDVVQSADEDLVTQGGTLTVAASATVYTRTWAGDNPSFSPDAIKNLSYTVTSTLSDPYTSDDLNGDCDDLLAQWDLSDDIQWLWRTDLNCTSGPIVSRFEYGPNAPGVIADCSFVDTNPADGSVLGGPLTAGSEPYFNFRALIYETLAGCTQVGRYGEAAPSWATHATQWTNILDAQAYLPGAFAAYNTLTVNNGCTADVQFMTGYLHKSKYAEVITLSVPSHNFDRPCGPKDQATIDQSTIVCTGGETADPGTFRWPDAAACPADKWNDDTTKGDWRLLTWAFDYRDVGERHRLKTTPTVGDFSLCEYDNTLAEIRPVTGPWKTISCNQYCSTFLPCCPASVFITPNGETASNATTIEHTNLACDDLYGARWQRLPQQWMTDPLWIAPARPCDLDGGIAWSEDDGSGLADTDSVHYYPQRPYEEAVCTLPVIGEDTAPALPSGCYIGVLSVDDINAGSTAGNIINPPGANTCFMTVWLWAANRYANILANGRFSCEYADPMAICEDDSEIDPP